MADLDRLAALNARIADAAIDPAVFAQIVNALPDGLVVINEAAEVRFVNMQVELMFGYPRADLLGEPVHKLLDPSIREQHAKHIAGFFVNPTPRPMNFARVLDGRHANGRKVQVQISIAPLIADEGVLAIAVIRRVAGGQ
ncbi:MAG TPA: PAS domain-containing protein [Xanthobacteraceae bacterium]|nr:PAS domain-containing protein [Xanthobacteraceae bacterium]